MHDHKQGAESLVEVTQADRERAAAFYGKYLARAGEVPVEAAFRTGHVDESPLIQAFARHRITATSEASLSVERMRRLVEAVERGEFDQLDAAADKWVEAAGVRRMMNAVASVFEKHASQDIMDRFRDKLVALAHLAFVEGAAIGVLQHRAALNTTAEGGER